MVILYKEDTDEMVMRIKYRYDAGHPIEADVELFFTMPQAMELYGEIGNVLEHYRDKYIEEKTTPVAEEANPMRNNSVQ